MTTKKRAVLFQQMSITAEINVKIQKQMSKLIVNLIIFRSFKVLSVVQFAAPQAIFSIGEGQKIIIQSIL